MQVYEIINKIIKNKNYKSYLEIGIQQGVTFNKVECEHKAGMDPVLYNAIPEMNIYKMTSDKYFEICKDTVDIVFIDGEHTFKQTLKDVINSLFILNTEGLLLMHDTSPSSEMMSRSYEWFKNSNYLGEWCGDVWKTVDFLRMYFGGNIFTLNIPYGLTVIKPKGLFKTGHDYEYFNKNRSKILNINKNWEILND